MATLAEQVTEKQAELTAIKAAISRILAGGQSSSIEGMNVSRASLSTLYAERNACEKSIQRLLRGGRGIHVDMSQPADQSEAVAVYTVTP